MNVSFGDIKADLLNADCAPFMLCSFQGCITLCQWLTLIFKKWVGHF